MTPSRDSTHSVVSSGSMSGSWLGRPSLITGRLRSVDTGVPSRLYSDRTCPLSFSSAATGLGGLGCGSMDHGLVEALCEPMSYPACLRCLPSRLRDAKCDARHDTGR